MKNLALFALGFALVFQWLAFTTRSTTLHGFTLATVAFGALCWMLAARLDHHDKHMALRDRVFLTYSPPLKSRNENEIRQLAASALEDLHVRQELLEHFGPMLLELSLRGSERLVAEATMHWKRLRTEGRSSGQGRM